MELRPVKKENVVLYPTIKEIPKSNNMKEMLLAATIAPSDIPPICVVAVPSNILPIGIYKLIRSVSIVLTIILSILLFINKIKINKCISDSEMTEELKKLNKGRKVKWCIWGICIATIIITSLVIFYLKNYM